MPNDADDDELSPATKLTAGILMVIGGGWGLSTADEWIYTIAGQEIPGTLLGGGMLLLGIVALVDGGRDYL